MEHLSNTNSDLGLLGQCHWLFAESDDTESYGASGDFEGNF